MTTHSHHPRGAGTARPAPTGARVVTDPKGLFGPEPDHPPRAKRDGGTPRQSPGGGLSAQFPAPLKSTAPTQRHPQPPRPAEGRLLPKGSRTAPAAGGSAPPAAAGTPLPPQRQRMVESSAPARRYARVLLDRPE
ncbi:hypothetical protein SBRY_30350 [Actinacidiphila bryophytorum]|uniref:Uncharacterized protein n=1 Tax=Actinacidiphila bryophytorum TaxID=1436133 RepID=A0A9W4MGJ7_9ACTN|nr:hypothetical protein SBRY_30350 [Actinacidiphila bryophytorum]